MITHIHVKNFKSWKDSGEVKLAPLTGFFGTNSSGKSSLLQMLLLLKQTIGREEVIFFGDETSLLNLGSFREVIHGHKENELLELEFGCKLKKPSNIIAYQEINKHIGNYELAPLDIDSFTFDTAIRGGSHGLSIERFCYTVGPEVIQKIGWQNGKLYHGKKSHGIIGGTNCYGHRARETDQSLSPLSAAFENLFANVYPLGPTRVHPQRHYHWKRTHPEEIDLQGDKAVDALLSARVRQLTTPHNGKNVSIEERISKWLRKLELAHSFSLVPKGSLDDNNYEVRFQTTSNSAEVTLADMGHGVSDLFPLLVHCCYVPEGSTLILEQPGIHLHPKAQADFADLLIEAITERNLQILIESHSEHLLTRLQLHIAEQKIAASDTALYFCENESGVSTIKSLGVDELGNITNWPPDFFGNVRGDLVKMTREQMKRQKETEGE